MPSSTQLPIRKRTCVSRICARERIVWAKLAGYKHWPARIIPDHLRASNPDYQQADPFKGKTDDTLVYFFGTHDLAWVSSKIALTPWKKGRQLRHHRPRFTSQKTKKKHLAQFEAAVGEVHNFCSERSNVTLSMEGSSSDAI